MANVKNEEWKSGYIDKSGNLVIPCIWKGAWAFSDGLAIVMDEEGNEHVIDKTGKIVE